MITLNNIHKYSSCNRELLKDINSCYFCLKNDIELGDIEEWIDNNTTALCPHCEVDSVVPGSLDEDLLMKACEMWFTGMNKRYKKMNKEQDKAFEDLTVLSQELGLYNWDVNTMGYPKIEADCFDEARFKANCKILNLLAELVNKRKDLRFGQILEIYNFIKADTAESGPNEYVIWTREISTEPQVILKRVEKRIEELK